jgi:hypothetical protein
MGMDLHPLVQGNQAVEQIEMLGIQCVVFYEPDDDLGRTAASTQPVDSTLRRLFRRFPLWNDPAFHPFERGPPASR